MADRDVVPFQVGLLWIRQHAFCALKGFPLSQHKSTKDRTLAGWLGMVHSRSQFVLSNQVAALALPAELANRSSQSELLHNTQTHPTEDVTSHRLVRSRGSAAPILFLSIIGLLTQPSFSISRLLTSQTLERSLLDRQHAHTLFSTHSFPHSLHVGVGVLEMRGETHCLKVAPSCAWAAHPRAAPTCGC